MGDGQMGCPGAPAKSNGYIYSLLLQPGKTPAATPAWCVPSSGNGHLNYMPISTTTDGVSANAIVWFVNGSQLEAIDGDSGKVLFTTTGAACDGVPAMAFPLAARNRIVIAALGHLCSWSVSGK